MAYTIQMDLSPSAHAARREVLNQAGYTSFVLSLGLLAGIFLASRGHTYKSPLAFRVFTSAPFGRQWGSFLTLFSVMLYLDVLVLLAAYRTGTDYLHLTKSFGHVAVAQLPAVILLGSKTGFASWSGGYERCNVWHRWLSRVVILGLGAHAGCYMWFFNETDRWWRFFGWDVLAGAAALWGMLVMASLYLDPVRVRWYRLFFIVHIVTAVNILPLIFFHVKQARPYAALSLLFLVLDRYFLRQTSKATIRVTQPTPTLLHITLTRPKPWGVSKPGAHVQISIPSLSGWSKIPLTIAQVEGNTLHLFARVRDGFTKKVAGLQTSSEGLACKVEGPYGGVPLWDAPAHTVVIVGGVGITFGASLSSRNVDVKWVVRTPTEIHALESLPGVKGDVFLTNDGDEKIDSIGNWRLVGLGRPGPREIIEEWMHEKDIGEGEKIGVAVCGPEGLAERVREEVLSELEGREVWFWREEFGW